ncbi:aspartate--tRNA ligase [Bhargavaea beijingensis]|uniref:Aspartate--tRNA ligase n=1 Tax=Bhargavaea beijingensis TaxID=426756 RepID=A0A1G7CLG5_9BACL|nr:aspartate--tRNA ligase [Bhargavaea beijingensis]MCW1927033.1 aspartate--tRNA ligase [Bhargavaea beijingensis]RSK30764.1 aspartate--tRNA ligase [Bhargavaea beijingensis]SDE40159.1 aspartyl-tRNA synthetase [Bhargavaea beijingensis]
MKRTNYCGEVTDAQIGQKVVLKGWVQRRRDLGGLIFVDLRDRTGIVQVVFNPDFSGEAMKTGDRLRNEFVVEVRGTVIGREENQVNPNLQTGRIEVQAEEIDIINEAKNPPFVIEDANHVGEETRLKYRYLDLRRPEMYRTFKMRSDIMKTVRNFLDDNGFMEVETPYLTKSTPEGARDYLVPSRVHDGEFYALPQSPQLFKQLLMVSGFDKYYQIVRCFRDEDLRADRQPEFTQIDMEMSFVEMEDVIELNETLMQKVMRDVKGVEVPVPFQRMTYDEAMARYGSDKPDVRFGLELQDVSEVVADSSFKVFAGAVSSGGQVKAINAKGAAGDYSRKDIDALGEFAGRYGAKGLAWMKVEEDGLKGPIAKFFEGETAERLKAALEAEPGDLLLFVADKKQVVADALGALRLKLGKERGLIDESRYAFLWVTDWPLFEYDEEEGRYYAAHHPFTMPVREDIEMLGTEPQEVRAMAYDMVLNGFELGGGSLRIYERDIQEKMFKALGFTEDEAKAQFGFLLDAFDYGTPPHGGIAFGLDRLAMLLAGATSLRDVIAFPKTASASDLMVEAPSGVSDAQLRELGIKLRNENKAEATNIQR